MTQTAKMISRRSVTTGLAAAVAALPAVGLARALPADDKLLRVISRYRAEIASLDASHGLTDEEIDAWVDRADAPHGGRRPSGADDGQRGRSH